MAFNLDGVLASTLPALNKKFQDNWSTKTPFFFKMKKTGGLNLREGGTELRFPVIVGNGIAGSYYGDDAYDMSIPGGLRYLTYNWKQFYSIAQIVGIEEVMNSGESAGPDLLDGRLQQAEITTAEKFEQMLFATGGGNDGKDWNSLQQLVADDPTSGTIGGLSRATITALQNQAYTTAVTGFNTAQAGRNALTTLWARCVNGLRQPNFSVTTVAIWTLYQLSLTTNERFVMENEKSSKEMRDAGFQSTSFMTAPLVFSSQCPASHLYMLRIAQPTSDGGLFLAISRQRNFKMMPWQKARNQDVRSSDILTAGELCCDAPYLQGVATNITG